jgi:hypothetical protein
VAPKHRGCHRDYRGRVQTRDTYYAKASDGALIAYQVFGDGPIDIIDQEDWPGNIDADWELSLGRIYFTELSPSRV